MIKLRKTIFFHYPQNNKSTKPNQICLSSRDTILDDFDTLEELFQKAYITVFPSTKSTAKKHGNSLPYRYYFKEADCQLHGQNAILLFNKSLSILLIYALICSFLDPKKKNLNHAQLCVSISQMNKLFSKTSRQYFKMQKPSLNQLTRNFTDCVPYLESGLDEYNYSVEYVRRKCLENSETWLFKALMSTGYQLFNFLFVSKDKVPILFIEGDRQIIEKDDEENEEEDEKEKEEGLVFCVTRLTVWPSAMNSIEWWIEEKLENEEGFELTDEEFACVLSSWLKADELNSIIILDPFPIQSKKKWIKIEWIWNIKCRRESHWDSSKKKQHCYAADLFEPLHEGQEKKRKRKKPYC